MSSPVLTHDALLYRDVEEYLTATTDFLRAGLAEGRRAMAAVPGPRLALLRDALGADAEWVRLEDMHDLGRNPARILPALLSFADSGPIVVVGEASWPGRRACEMAEARRHEALVNLAFAEQSARILCPFDATLEAEADLTHPTCGGERSTAYADPFATWAAADRPLAGAAAPLARIDVEADVGDVRRAVRAVAEEAGLPPDAAGELLVATSEAVTNAILHGRPPVTVTLWLDADDVVVDVTDHGRFTDPLAGRRRPPLDAVNGRGLFIVNQLCDLVELHTGDAGTTVRMRMARTR